MGQIVGPGAPKHRGARGRVPTLAWASSRERRRRSCCLLGPGWAWGAGSSGDAWERTRRSSLRCAYWSWARRSACTASFCGRRRDAVTASSSPPPARFPRPHPRPYHPLLFLHPLLFKLLPPLLNLSPFGSQGLGRMENGDAASGLLDHSIHWGHMSFILWTLFWVCTLSPGSSHPEDLCPPPARCLQKESQWSPPSFVPGRKDAKALFLGTLGTSPRGPQKNKSTVLQ